MTDPTLWNQLLIWPMLNFLIGLYKGISLLKIPGAFGWAIICATVFIRLALAPLYKTQISSAQKMAQLKPKLDELSQKHKQDKVKLQQAQLELYKQAGVNPLAGCLPLIVQTLLFIALYRVFIQVLSNGGSDSFISQVNQILYHPLLKIDLINFAFFGVDLAVKPSQWQQFGIGLLLIPPLTAALQWWQTRLMSNTQTLTSSQPTKKKPEDQMAQMQKQMTYMFPIMIGFLAFSFPVGLALYWNTFNIFGIIQQIRFKLVAS